MATHNEVALRVDPVSVRALQMISEGRFIISEDGENSGFETTVVEVRVATHREW